MSTPPPAHRMLNACPGCARQYDVTHLARGADVRCACGLVFPAQHRAPRSPRALRCSSCGGNLREHARACDYCAAEITLEERRLGGVCPTCFARARLDARYCMECGTGIEPQALAAVPAELACPRCEGELRSRALDRAAVVECTQCGGLWLEPRTFDALCLRAERQLEAEVPADRPRGPAPADVARYIPCLRCGDMMTRKNYAGRSGVVIDVCRDHGVWLDHGEVERVVAWLRAGGRAQSPWLDPVPAAVRPGGGGVEIERAPRSRWQTTVDFVVDVLETLFVAP